MAVLGLTWSVRSGEGCRRKGGAKSHWQIYDFRVTWPPVLAVCKLTWLVLGEDPAARSHRVEQFTAL